MNSIKKLILSLILTFNYFSVYAEGQLMVMPIKNEVLNMTPSKLRLSNSGDKPLFLNLDLSRIDNPGDKPEKKTKIGDISNPELMVNTTKITLGPGQKKEVLITPLKSPSSEAVYRLYVIPVSGIKIKSLENDGKIQAPFTFGVGYGVLIQHYPELNSQIKVLSHYCRDGGVYLKSNGNVHNEIYLTEIDGKKNIDRFNVFPGVDRFISSKHIKGLNDGEKFEINCN